MFQEPHPRQQLRTFRCNSISYQTCRKFNSSRVSLVSLSLVSVIRVNSGLNILKVPERNKQFMHFKLQAVLSSLTKSCTIPLYPGPAINSLPAHPRCFCYPLISHLVTIPVIRDRGDWGNYCIAFSETWLLILKKNL